MTGRCLTCGDIFDTDDSFPALLTIESAVITIQLANRYEREFIDSSYVNILKDDNVLTLISQK